MAPRQSKRRFQGQGSPRGRTGRLLWAGVAATAISALGIGNQSGLSIVDPVTDAFSVGSTIRRIRGFVTLRGQAEGLNILWRMGVITMGDDAFVAGAFPDPWADPAQWMYENAGRIEGDVVNRGTTRLDIDIKVSRRLPEAHTRLVVILENLAGSADVLEHFQSWKALLWVP